MFLISVADKNGKISATQPDPIELTVLEIKKAISNQLKEALKSLFCLNL